MTEREANASPKDAALKLALEALDGLYLPGELERVNKAITAIKEALAFPQRTWEKPWVSLTDDDVDEMWERTGDYDSFANAIEAKLKEKNT